MTWARELKERCQQHGPSPIPLRTLLERHKLRALQVFLSLKILLRRAQSDHYALYGALVVLRRSGLPRFLLDLAARDSILLDECGDALQALAAYRARGAGRIA